MDDASIDLRTMSREVLAELAAGWIPVYQAALDLQARNPDLLAMAEKCPTYSPEGGRRLIPLLAMAQHPQVLRSCIAWCEAVSGELLFADDPVTPQVQAGGVSGERDEEASKLHDRLAKLEDENAALRYKVDYLSRSLAVVRTALDAAGEVASASAR